MKLNPYDCTVTRAYNVKKLEQEVTAAALHDEVRTGVYIIGEGDSRINTLTQPLLFKVPSSRDPLIAVDFRPYKGDSSYAKEMREVLLSRARLTLHCAIDGSALDLYTPVAQMAFAGILSGIISNWGGMEPAKRMQLMAVAGAHYYNMTHSFEGEGGYTDNERLLLTSNLVKNLRIPTDVADATLGLMSNGDTLEAFAENVKAVDQTDRTKSLNQGVLVNGCAGLWYGTGSTELVAVAFEHAPTFCAMLSAALGNGGYSRSELAKRLKYNSQIKQRADYFQAAIRTIESEFE